MGMYDYLNAEQVKCFYIPAYYWTEIESEMGYSSIHHSGGRLKTYKNGDKLPTQTQWYKYPSNFIILDYRVGDTYICPNCGKVVSDEICTKCNTYLTEQNKAIGIVHVVKNDRLAGTYYDLNKLPKKLFKNNELVIDYYGQPIFNITSIETLKEYFIDFKKYQTQHFAILEKYGKATKEYFTEFRDQIQGKIPEDKEKLARLEKIYNEQSELRDEEIKKNKQPLIEKYASNREYESIIPVMEFGEYIACYSSMILRDMRDSENQMAHFKEEFKTFLKNNPDIHEKYFTWKDTEEAEKERILNILKLMA